MANVTIQAFDGLSQSVSSGKNRAETFNSWAYSQDLCFGQDKITLLPISRLYFLTPSWISDRNSTALNYNNDEHLTNI